MSEAQFIAKNGDGIEASIKALKDPKVKDFLLITLYDDRGPILQSSGMNKTPMCDLIDIERAVSGFALAQTGWLDKLKQATSSEQIEFIISQIGKMFASMLYFRCNSLINVLEDTTGVKDGSIKKLFYDDIQTEYAVDPEAFVEMANAEKAKSGKKYAEIKRKSNDDKESYAEKWEGLLDED